MGSINIGEATSTHTAVNAAKFVDSIGVNAHLSYNDTAYADIDMVRNAISYLGIANIRDIVAPWSEDNIRLLVKDGVKFDIVIASNLELDYQKQTIAGMADALRYVEGPNEVDFWPVTFQGQTGFAGAHALMRNLHDWMKSGAVTDATGAQIPLLSLTFGQGESWSRFGDISGLADYGNIHGYVPYGWSAGSMLAEHIKNAEMVNGKGIGMVVTEAGFHTAIGEANSTGVTEEIQAKNTLNLLFEYFKGGVSVTYLYELLDMNTASDGSNGENHFGLFHTDGTPKMVATAIHNLTTILTSSNYSGEPGSLDYALSGMPSSADSLLMQHGANDFVLAVWDDADNWNEATAKPIYHAATSVDMNLANWSGLVKIYDPMVSSATPIRSFYTNGDFSIDVEDHVTLVELNAAQSGTNGNDLLRATADGVAILGMAGADKIYGSGGDDHLDGGAGNDTIEGGAGRDRLIGGGGRDVFVFDSSSGQATIADFVPGEDQIQVTQSMFATAEAVLAAARKAGSDVVIQADGVKITLEGVGLRDLTRDSFTVISDIVTGTNRIDTLQGTKASEIFYGLKRGDTIIGGDGDDHLNGGGGNDWIYGGKGNSTIVGGRGDDMIFGGKGSELFIAGPGKDTYNAGAGIDTISFGSFKGDITIDLDPVNGFANGSTMSRNVLKGFENVIGGAGSDTITGNRLDNVFTGGAGSDRFNFSGSFGSDRITDFNSDEDRIHFDSAMFANFNAVARASHQEGRNLVIDSGHGDLTIANTTIGHMADAFIF